MRPAARPHVPPEVWLCPRRTATMADPLDVLVLSLEPALPGSVVPGLLIGVLKAEQTEDGKTVRNDRLAVVTETPYNPLRHRELRELGEAYLAEIEHFLGIPRRGTSHTADGCPTSSVIHRPIHH